MQTDSMLKSHEWEEIDSIMAEFDRVDLALGAYLAGRCRPRGTGESDNPASWLRTRVQQWCDATRGTRLISDEVVATTELALGQMEDDLLVPLVIDLMDRAQRSASPRRIRRRRRAG